MGAIEIEDEEQVAEIVDEVELASNEDSCSESSEDELDEEPPLKKAKRNTGPSKLEPDVKAFFEESDDTAILKEMFEKKNEIAEKKLRIQEITETRLSIETLLKSGMDSTSVIIQGLTKKLVDLLSNTDTSKPEEVLSNLPQ